MTLSRLLYILKSHFLTCKGGTILSHQNVLRVNIMFPVLKGVPGHSKLISIIIIVNIVVLLFASPLPYLSS
jgi:hypothetical protein